ncbi:MAG: hypothetical protein V2A63_02820 [Patescibacteria group bacterium]
MKKTLGDGCGGGCCSFGPGCGSCGSCGGCGFGPGCGGCGCGK